MHVQDFLRLECVKVPLEATTKWEAVEELIDILANQGQLGDTGKILRKLRDREELSPQGTFLSEFLAIPHVVDVMDCEGTHLAVGKAQSTIDWEHEHGTPSPAELVVLLISSVGQGEAIRSLARIIDILESERAKNAVRHATSSKEIYDIIVHEDEVAQHVESLPREGVEPWRKLK